VILRKADGSLEELRTRSLGLGMQQEGHFSEIEVKLGKDESLHIYTDGLTEATNGAGTQFDAAGLRDVLTQFGDRDARECSRAVIQAVQDFMTKQEFRDDATIVTIHAIESAFASSSPDGHP